MKFMSREPVMTPEQQARVNAKANMRTAGAIAREASNKNAHEAGVARIHAAQAKARQTSSSKRI